MECDREMIRLLLTADYEIFGDGSGCVRWCLNNPTNKLMQVCEWVGTRITFFVDICEYWAFRQAEDSGILSDEYRPATWIECQLRDAIKRGHDVQLHLHPQWIEYRFESARKWEVNLKYWRLPLVPGGYGSAEDRTSLLGLFVQGRSTLEKMLKTIDPEYECRAFRAGAWCIQPEAEVLRAMNEAGIWYDTTVAPGLSMNNGLTLFDFSKVPRNLTHWKVRDRIDSVAEDGSVCEVPIFTSDINLTTRVFWKILKRMKRIKSWPERCSGQSASTTVAETRRRMAGNLKRKFSSQVRMFDYCCSTSVEMKTFLKQAQRRFLGDDPSKNIPVVAIGHPKSFANPEELNNFLMWARKQKYISLEPLGGPGFWRLNPSCI